MISEKEKDKIRAAVQSEIDEGKEEIQRKLDRLLGKGLSEYQYKRRIDKIYKLLRDTLMLGQNHKKLIRSADFYQKIELFMNYRRDTATGLIETPIDKLIGEVFKSMYINFILHFLDDEGDFPIPYLGMLRIKEIDRFNPLWNKNIHYFYGRVYLDEGLRKDLQNINKGEKIGMVKDAINDMGEILSEKVF
jgi:hypothetical protein